jgi:hypothetical protein
MKTLIARYVGAVGLGAVLALTAATSSFAQRRSKLHTALRQFRCPDGALLLRVSNFQAESPARAGLFFCRRAHRGFVLLRPESIAAPCDSHGSNAAGPHAGTMISTSRASAPLARECEGFRHFSSDKAMCI